MEEQQLFDITFSKVYEEIDNVSYSCENVLRRLCDSGLISENSRREIEQQKEAFDQNRYMIDVLRRRVRNDDQFKKLLKFFYSEGDFYVVAESMKMVYFILRSEENIIKTLQYDSLLLCLRKRSFFTKREESTLLKRKKEVKEIIEILKDKGMPYFKTFLLCLKELKQDGLILPTVSLSSKYPSCKLDTLKYCLIKQYTNDSFRQVSELDLPLSDDINIALIEVCEDDHKKNSFFDYHSLLLKQETSYTRTVLTSYLDIVAENCRVVLVQGYPGSGKTCLAKQLCTKWAKGELLQTFSCVIFLQLRDEDVANANSLKALIELHVGSLSASTVGEIHESHGRGLLIILEGWDELPDTKQCSSSLFTHLISDTLAECLSEAVILITSRPSAVRSLQFKYIKRRIEILGFTEQQISLYITQYFQKYNNGTMLVEQFTSELKRLPLLRSFVFVPINLSISLYIFNAHDYALPDTFTSMYKELVLIQLQRYQTRISYGSSSIKDLNTLPTEIDDMLLGLSKMAYDNMQKNITLIFDEAIIKQYCFDSADKNLDGFDGMGLLQVTNHKHYLSMNKTYEFIHRTLQELLAAWYLSRQDKSVQKKQLQTIFNKKEFEMIWIFYAGLTNFKHVSFKDFLPENYMLKIKMASYSAFTWFLRKIIRNALANLNYPGMGEIIDKFVCGKQYSYDLSHCISMEFQTTLIAAVMEAQNPQLCKDICESYLFNREVCWLTVPESAATSQILSAVSYCIAHSGKKWMIQCKSFDEIGAENLLKYLTHSKDNERSNTNICVFDTAADCSQSPISGIPILVRKHQHLQWLLLSNSKQADDKFVSDLAEALKYNTCIQLFHLVGCNISGNSLKAVAHMLQLNRTLQWIGLANNRSTLTEEDIIMLLQTVRFHNNIVFMMFLDNSFHTADKVQEQLQILNFAREERGVRKLSLTLMDCYKHHEIFERIISLVPFMQDKVSPSSITTRVVGTKDITSGDGDAATRDDTASDIQSQQQETVYFGEYPVDIVCPECGEKRTTKTTFVTGLMTWLLVMALFCTIWLMPFALWPLFLDLCKDVHHSCPKCNAHLGVYKRM